VLGAVCRRWGKPLRLIAGVVALVLTLEAGRWLILMSGRGLSHIPFTWPQALPLGCAGGLAFSRTAFRTTALSFWLLPGAAGVLIFTFLPTASGTTHVALLSLLSLCCTVVVLNAADGPGWFRGTLSAAPLVWLGRRSYGLYLWHVPILEAARHFEPDLGILSSLVAIAISVGVTELSYRVVEQPFLRLKR